MHKAKSCINTSEPCVAPTIVKCDPRDLSEAKVLHLSVIYVRTRYAPEVTVYVPIPGGSRPVRGRVVGLQFVQGRLNHYRVKPADGGLLLAPPSWFRGTINLLASN